MNIDKLTDVGISASLSSMEEFRRLARARLSQAGEQASRAETELNAWGRMLATVDQCAEMLRGEQTRRREAAEKEAKS